MCLAGELRFTRDPFDAPIVAAARTLALPLVTRDRDIRASGAVHVIWYPDRAGLPPSAIGPAAPWPGDRDDGHRVGTADLPSARSGAPSPSLGAPLTHLPGGRASLCSPGSRQG